MTVKKTLKRLTTEREKKQYHKILHTVEFKYKGIIEKWRRKISSKPPVTTIKTRENIDIQTSTGNTIEIQRTGAPCFVFRSISNMRIPGEGNSAPIDVRTAQFDSRYRESNESKTV